jgi:hypothetical protein
MRPLLGLFLSAGLLASLGGCTRVDTFHVRRAALDDPRYLQEFEARRQVLGRDALGLYAHRIAPGDGWVMAYRRFSPGGVFTIDDESFEKLTLCLAEPRMHGERTVELPSSEALVVYSRGGSAWPVAACSGWLSTGQVRIQPKGQRILVEVSGALAETTGSCPPSIALSFEANDLKDVSLLTPWLGAKGDSPYSESYRR